MLHIPETLNRLIKDQECILCSLGRGGRVEDVEQEREARTDEIDCG